ncbi:MAG TPA: glutathione S-transferase [Fluviicoccus sp.]|nr:glutathione S-transferase [Fluviicoccus sp.]
MKLIASLTSPFARKVRILLLEKRLPFELVVDIPWNAETRVPDFNPLGKVPVLLNPDGESFYDSRVIAEYLELAAGPCFIPDQPERRIAVRRMEALADGISDAAATVFLERKRPREQVSEEWIERQMLKMDRGLAAAVVMLPAAPDAAPDLGQIALECALGYLDLRFPEYGWRERFPELAAFHHRMLQRESIRATLPPA